MNFNDFFNRAKNLILNPPVEWVRIEAETSPRKEIVKGYVIPFAVLIMVCSLIGDSFFSLQPYTTDIIITKAIVSGIMLVVGVYLSALIINELTASFSIPKNHDGTFKLITYSFTSSFIASCLVGLLPDLPILLVLALHSVYLYWLGTTIVLKVSEESKIGFVIVSLLIIVGIFAILKLLIGTIVSGMLYISGSI